jgi:diacylglycerol kinase family enzyme
MKKAHVLHNPGAGTSENSEEKLMAAIEAEGYKCSYLSTKQKGWENIESENMDFIIVAGGDGTVRKLAGELLERKLIDKKLPIALLPQGTANNIAKTLGISGGATEIIKSWKQHELKKFDVGRIEGIEKANFFIESLGYGIFPRLMKEMKKVEKNVSDIPGTRLNIALGLLHEIILTYKGRYCKIQIDDQDYSGKYLLVEVMNTISIGPNLNLAPFADPGDGFLEVVLIPESQRQEFADYVKGRLNKKEEAPFFKVLKAKKLHTYWEGKALHVDDEYIQLDEATAMKIEIQAGLLEFLVPAKAAP